MDPNQGTIFNIQKFSLNDGPGIRTVVFFKGCPLRCRWCSNPESQLIRPQIMWDPQQCLHCGHCQEVCPRTAARHENNQVMIDTGLCTGCLLCANSCPAGALKSEGRLSTVEDIMKIILQDLPFYEESGGGITLSGGEFLSQPAFASALLRACREEGINTCCETTGYAPQEIFAQVIPYLDEILFDVKHYDSETHRKGTGVGNELILSNLSYAISQGKDVLPRIPVIPGFNDSDGDAAALADCLKKAGAGRCQLLPFHQFGENKYTQLGREYALKDVSALHKEDLAGYRDILIRKGIDAFF